MVFAFVITVSAQFYLTDFNSTDFPAGDPLGNNADWNSEAAWVGNASNQIRNDKANWEKALLDKAITASDGQNFGTATVK